MRLVEEKSLKFVIVDRDSVYEDNSIKEDAVVFDNGTVLGDQAFRLVAHKTDKAKCLVYLSNSSVSCPKFLRVGYRRGETIPPNLKKISL